jgi:hypothetical protein
MKSFRKGCADFLPGVVLTTNDEDSAIDASFWFLLFQCQVKDLKNEWRNVLNVDLEFAIRYRSVECEKDRLDLQY